MSHYLDGKEHTVNVKMYAGRAIGVSFPTDGNKHHEPWVQRFKGFGVTVWTYEDGELISVEVDLPEDVVHLSTECRAPTVRK